MDELDDEPVQSQNQKNSVQAENKILATEKTPPNTDIDPTVDPLTDTPRTHIVAHTTCTII